MNSPLPRTDLSALRYFFQYFCDPEFGVEWTSTDAAVRSFVRQARPGRLAATMTQLATLVKWLHDTSADADAIKRTVTDLGSNYNPGAENLSDLQWLERLLGSLKSAATKTAPVAPDEMKTRQDQRPDIEVINPPRDLNPSTGLFLVTVVTRKNGQPANRKFFASAPTKLDIRQETPEGLISVGTYTPWSDGIYHLHIGFEGVMTTISFIADSGETAVVHLRK